MNIPGTSSFELAFGYTDIVVYYSDSNGSVKNLISNPNTFNVDCSQLNCDSSSKAYFLVRGLKNK